MDAKHIPGPSWRIEMHPYPHVRTADTNLCVFANDYAPLESCRLIAAAPDMLQALKRIREAALQGVLTPDLCAEIVTAAIAKTEVLP